MKGAILIPASGLALLFSCSSNPETSTTSDVAKTEALDSRPLKDVDVPTEIRIFVAEKGDTFLFPSGSMIIMPENSVLNSEGQPVRGEVELKFKEYRDPVDFFVSGIPMSYDSAGTSYIFESAGMCDIRAFQDGTALKVNPSSKPRVILATKNADPQQNLYDFNEESRRWENVGKSKIERTEEVVQGNQKLSESFSEFQEALDNDPIKPVPPRKADPDQPQFEIELDKRGTFPEELRAYNNLRFEVAREEKNFDDKYSNIDWLDMRVVPTDKEGLYKITFIRFDLEVSFLVRPVLEGRDYSAAVAVFKKQQAIYEKTLAERLQKEEAERKEEELRQKQMLASRKEKRENPELIELRAKAMQKENERRKNFATADSKSNQILQSQLYRSFELDDFGIFNCDKPHLLGDQELLAKFRNDEGNNLIIRSSFSQIGTFNGIIQNSDDRVRVHPDSAFYFMAALNNRVYYFSEKNPQKLKKMVKNGDFLMNLKSSDKAFASTEEIRELLYN